MKQTRVAINGFGRIGRLSLRALLQKKNLEVVAVNDLTDAPTLAHLFKYDSNYGPFPGHVTYDQENLIIDGRKIRVYAQSNPTNLPWEALQIDTVLEATGRFLDKPSNTQHLTAGAKRVVISAPASEDIPTIVLGVNDHILPTAGPILSNASCTTNCLAPLAYLLDTHFGIERGYINTIHAYTADQRLQDAPHKDLRRARSATKSIIPTTTGAAKSIGTVLPQLQGKLDGISMRVPVSDGSILDLTAILRKPATKEIINATMKQAAEGNMKGILAYTEDPIVSVDIIGNPHSCIFDAQLTYTQGNLVKVIAWYDNEGGYAHRIADLISRLNN
ncbi:MAG: type I glyceraldehyde-3-phosphate dehydrogenase [Candidatus Amoebophilus sp. 36-38]|nr:MAG: type I glyceraldehyde-3-phosphate dehydrogenase [Candidatus Amoebophilus sp. 36-38]